MGETNLVRIICFTLLGVLIAFLMAIRFAPRGYVAPIAVGGCILVAMATTVLALRLKK